MRRSDAARTQRFRPDHVNRRLVSGGLVPAAVLAGSLGATSLAGASSPHPVVTTAKIAGLGTVLVASHRPLYEMANDPIGKTTCTGACTKIWKPLMVSHNAAHHLGHVPGLGTIHRSHKLQVAVHGHALYFFAADNSETHAGGQGIANNWFTVNANGTINRTTTSSAPMATVPPASPSGSSPSSSTTPPSPSPSPAKPSSPGPTMPAPANPAPATPAPTSPPPTSPPATTPPPPPTTTPPPPPPPPPPPTTTTTTSGGGGGVGF